MKLESDGLKIKEVAAFNEAQKCHANWIKTARVKRPVTNGVLKDGEENSCDGDFLLSRRCVFAPVRLGRNRSG